MTPEHLSRLLHGGEGPTVEFKRAREALNRDVYETICAFLNQRGGTLVLGAANDGSIRGIAPEAVTQIRKDLVNTLHKLGSGVRNLFKYARAFGGQDPILSEESIFRVAVMLPPAANISAVLPALTGSATGSPPASATQSPTQSPTQSATQSNEQVARLLHALASGETLSATTLRERLGIRHRPTFRQNYLDPALAAGLIAYTVPDKPASRLQKYRLTPTGQALVNQAS